MLSGLGRESFLSSSIEGVYLQKTSNSQDHLKAPKKLLPPPFSPPPFVSLPTKALTQMMAILENAKQTLQ